MEIKSGNANLYIQAQQVSLTEAKVTETSVKTEDRVSVLQAHFMKAHEQKFSPGIASQISEFKLTGNTREAELSFMLKENFHGIRLEQNVSLPDLESNSDDEIVAENIQAKTVIESAEMLEYLKHKPPSDNTETDDDNP